MTTFRNVSGFGLQGTLPSDPFTSLTELTSLDLYNNFLTSPLPSMSMLTQLHDLYVKFSLLLYNSILTPITCPSNTIIVKETQLFDNSCFAFCNSYSLFIAIVMPYTRDYIFKEFINECIQQGISERYTKLQRPGRIVSLYF